MFVAFQIKSDQQESLYPLRSGFLCDSLGSLSLVVFHFALNS